ncbi:uroporphyrinogen-III synthase [Methylocystis sp. ATCC 49242]|uniref:uroporphyrinogen-III synthase n=1 Tax=Methylocystis sp. ATCC 49242 TaxID=622637 RepID=UPI0001F8735E|nr:uroporphyrinogen-III synthase [Methylocystis sp. ATCC 49242]
MKRVLVLRAREDAARTSEKLRALGFESVLSPVLEIVATGAAIPSGEFDAVLASSAKGVECAGNISALLRLPFHAVGAKTAKAAETRGWRPDIVAGNAEAILPLLLARYAQPAHFLYLAGRDRQAALEAGLRAAGHRVTAVDVYAARAATALGEDARRALAAGDIDIALHYSRRSVEIFLALAEAVGLTPRLGGVTHLALSDDVATPLRAIALEPRVAQKPNEERLLALLRQV